MKTSPTKRSFQTALALTLLACSGLSGCSDSQKLSGSNAGGTATVTAGARAKTPSATAKASGKAKGTGTSTATSTPKGTGTPTATASPTLIMTPELEASKKRALATPPPPKPELITVNSDDGAIATAKYWVQLYGYIYTTGRTAEYEALCPSDSVTCVNPVKHAKENHAAGGWMDPVQRRFTKAFRREDFPNSMVVQVNYEYDAFNQYHEDGTVKHFDSGYRWAAVELRYIDGQWTVVRHKDEPFN